MKRQPGQLPYRYTDPKERRQPFHDSLDCNMDTTERRAIPLTRDGINCILALGYSRYKSPRPHLPEHTHPGCLEINFCMRGSLVFESRGNPVDLRPGNVFLPKSDEPHHLVTNSKGLYMYWMVFRFPKGKETLLDLPRTESDAMIRRLRNLPRNHFQAAAGLRECFQELFHLHDDVAPGPFRTLKMRATALALLFKLVESAERPPSVNKFPVFDQLIDNIRRTPEKEFSVAELAKKANLSTSRFTALFRQATGLPPHAFILKTRLSVAKDEIAKGIDSISTIALSLGFSSARHLSTLFKASYGYTPSTMKPPRKA